MAVILYLPTKVAWLSFLGAFRSPTEKRQKAVVEIQSTAKMLCRILGLHIEIQGEIPDLKKGLVCANHLSYIDMVVLASVLPVCFVAKMEVRSRPIFGWIASTFETIFVKRGFNAQSDKDNFVHEVQLRLQEGYRVLVFPEGRATFGDQVYPFKTGAFEALVGTDIPVLPIYWGMHRMDGKLPIGDVRWQICWHDPMPIYRHLWGLFGLKNTLFRIVPCAPFLPESMDRRAMAAEAQHRIAEKHAAHFAELGAIEGVSTTPKAES